MAIVNQMNTQRVVVGTQIKYQIKTGRKVYFMESALVNGTNGWLMRINSFEGETVGRRTNWEWKCGQSVFFSCPRAAASAVMTTLRAVVHTPPSTRDRFTSTVAILHSWSLTHGSKMRNQVSKHCFVPLRYIPSRPKTRTRENRSASG